MISKGVLLRDQRGRITFRDGTTVRREPGETLIEAATKHKSMQSHFFITTSQNEASDYYQSEPEADEECKADVLAAEHWPKNDQGGSQGNI